MLPYPLLYDLVRQRQHELEAEAERALLIKTAMETGRATRRISARAWLGERLISWGTRLQGDALSMPVHRPQRAPYSN